MILLVLASFRTTSTGRFPRFPTFHTKYSEKMDVSFSKFSCFLALHLLLRLLYWKQDGFTRIKQTYGINNVGLTHSSLLLFFFFESRHERATSKPTTKTHAQDTRWSTWVYNGSWFGIVNGFGWLFVMW